jgi:predicted ATPase
VARPGIGKSRLASELAAEAQVRGATVLAGRAVPASGSIPYRPLTEALQQAASGVPRSFADGVHSRLAALSDGERLVLHTAALLGRQFDWRLLQAATGLHADLIAGALEQGVGAQLLVLDGDAFRFRHMLTREAVAAELLPPRRVAIAARALAALEAAHPGLPRGVG